MTEIPAYIATYKKKHMGLGHAMLPYTVSQPLNNHRNG